MKTKFILSALMAAALFGGCSKDVTEEMPSDGNRVVFTLGGSTRAAGDNDTHSTLASTDDEKKISSLIAVAFGSDGAYYKSFEAVYDDGQKTATFDLEKNGTYDIYFVANADDGLKGALMTLTDQNSDQSVTAADLASLVVTQALSDDTAKHDFVMLSDGPKKVVSQHGTTVNGGLVMMRRLAVRFDLVNAAEGVEITSVKFVNRTKASRLDASNDMNFASGSLYEDKTYDNLGLAGNYQTPAKYEAKIYSYENVNTGSDNLPSLEITYTMDGLTLTHTVKFYDSTSENGTTPLALKRNYLYRIVLTKPMDVEFAVTVDDWNSAAAFQITDLPFENTAPNQSELNAKLKVNMFTPYNVLSLDKNTKNVKFYDKMATSRDECPTTSYFTYNWLAGKEDGTYSSNGANTDTDLRNEVFTDDAGNKYRLPTLGELELLAPVASEHSDRPHVDIDGKWVSAADGSGNGVTYPAWFCIPDGITMIQKDQDGNVYSFTETLYFDNDGDFASDSAGESITGTSYIRLGELSHTYDWEDVTYDMYVVYALRFKGTSEFAAYRYECCEEGNVHYLSIRIKALPADSSITIGDLVGNNSFWNSGYIEYKFPAAGFYIENTLPSQEPDEDNATWRNLNLYTWSSTTLNAEVACQFGFGADDVMISNNGAITQSKQLRLVKVSE